MSEKSIRQLAIESGIDPDTAARMQQGSSEVKELRRFELMREDHRRVSDVINDLIEETTGVRLRGEPKRKPPTNRPTVAHF